MCLGELLPTTKDDFDKVNEVYTFFPRSYIEDDKRFWHSFLIGIINHKKKNPHLNKYIFREYRFQPDRNKLNQIKIHRSTKDRGKRYVELIRNRWLRYPIEEIEAMYDLGCEIIDRALATKDEQYKTFTDKDYQQELESVNKFYSRVNKAFSSREKNSEHTISDRLKLKKLRLKIAWLRCQKRRAKRKLKTLSVHDSPYLFDFIKEKHDKAAKQLRKDIKTREWLYKQITKQQKAHLAELKLNEYRSNYHNLKHIRLAKIYEIPPKNINQFLRLNALRNRTNNPTIINSMTTIAVASIQKMGITEEDVIRHLRHNIVKGDQQYYKEDFISSIPIPNKRDADLAIHFPIEDKIIISGNFSSMIGNQIRWQRSLFIGCLFDKVRFYGGIIEKSHFIACQFIAAELPNVKFIGCKFDACRFTRAVLNENNFFEQDFSYCLGIFKKKKQIIKTI